jgi:polar amino acid transport system substrate-binding protein
MHKSASNQDHRPQRSIAFAILVTAACAVFTAVPALAATAKPAPAAAPAMAEPAQPMAPAPTTTLDRVRSAGKIVFGYRDDAGTMSSRDASGQPTGYAVALCGRLAEMLKANLSLPSLGVEWIAIGAGYADLDQHRVDLVCSADEVTLAHRAAASFSIPVFPGGISALVSTGVSKDLQAALEERRPPYQPLWRGTPPPALAHRTYAALGGSTTLDVLKERLTSMRLTASVASVDSYQTGVAAVHNGQADVLFGDRAQLLEAAARSPDAKDLRVLSTHFEFASRALALARNDDDFRLAVDRALTQVYDNPQFGALYTATFGAPDAATVAFFRAAGLPK